MDSISATAAVAASSSGDPGTVQGAAAVSVLKKAMNLQATFANQLIETLPQPALASTGPVGTKLNTYA